MFDKRGGKPRIDRAQELGRDPYQGLDLAADFQEALETVRYCLKIRNQYAHWIFWDDNTGNLAFANFEDPTLDERPIKDLGELNAQYVDATLLSEQEAYFIYADKYILWINYEGRARDGKLPGGNQLKKPTPMKRPELYL